MKRNLQTALHFLDGKPLVEATKTGTDEAGKDIIEQRPITLAGIAVNALLAQHEDERALPGADKVKRYKLAQKIHDAAGEMDVTAEDVALLKTLIGKTYPPLLVGLAWQILEADPATEVVDGRT